jgi:hypothetical protein
MTFYMVPIMVARSPASKSGRSTPASLIARGDIHRVILENPDLLGVSLPTLNPDDLADTVWQLYADRTEAEAVINESVA